MFIIGDYVETKQGVNGILLELKKSNNMGEMAFIATSDMQTYCCDVKDIVDWSE